MPFTKLARTTGVALTTLALILGPTASLQAQQAADAIAPEIASGISDREAVSTEKFMVAAAHPQAVKAGHDVLAAGGNAIDAMVAVQLVLGLVEPQSSGIGGGAFLVYWDAAGDRLTTYDGRETAPMAATPLLFLKDDGEPMKFFDAVVGGRSVGTPGTLKLLYETHKLHGKLPWSGLVQPAITLADLGFEVSPRLSQSTAADAERLSVHPETKKYFLKVDGTPHDVGHQLKNPAYAETLRKIADGGADAFYKGPVAMGIVETVINNDNPGVLQPADLANYQIKERPPVCAPYRGYDICGMGPPSSGALTVGQILGLLEPYDLATLGPNDPESWRLIGDASRLAFADRGRYMADSDFVPMPTKGELYRKVTFSELFAIRFIRFWPSWRGWIEKRLAHVLFRHFRHVVLPLHFGHRWLVVRIGKLFSCRLWFLVFHFAVAPFGTIRLPDFFCSAPIADCVDPQSDIQDGRSRAERRTVRSF